MKLTKCANGHFYDTERYSTCPYCSGGSNSEMVTESFSGSRIPDEGKGFADDVTVSNPVFEGGRNINTGRTYSNVTDLEPAYPEKTSSGSPRTSGSVPEDDDEKTQGILNLDAIASNEIKRAGGEMITKDEQRQETARMVVGWLVCISGSNYGNSFCLYTGRNFIGRDRSNEVCLKGDMGISRIKHAVIVYEPKKRKFYAQPGDSTHELFYLNDEVVLTNTLLNDRDVLTIGQNTLVFVPFCDERNGWETPGQMTE